MRACVVLAEVDGSVKPDFTGQGVARSPESMHASAVEHLGVPYTRTFCTMQKSMCKMLRKMRKGSWPMLLKHPLIMSKQRRMQWR